MLVLFKNEPVTDNRIGKVILKKICIENDIDIDNVYLNPHFKYVETVNFNKKDADFCKTVYKGATYKVQYQSGCFNPYIVKVES